LTNKHFLASLGILRETLIHHWTYMKEKAAERTRQFFYRTDHLANERTFLAWIRTSIGIMAFGFVVERFTFFMRQITAFLEKSNLPEGTLAHPSIPSYSSIFGIFVVALGALLCIPAFIKFKNIEKQINDNTQYPSTMLDALLALFLFVTGILLAFYLLNST
jgi:putative membrane protein